MRCVICKKDSDEVALFDGIFDDEMVNVCESCAEKEEIPIIKRPSGTQLNLVEEKQSVRERMERISGFRDATDISGDQAVIQGHVARLKIPEKKESNDDVLDNYSWLLNISRRRRKLSINQLSEKIGISPEIIKSIERGKIPENFEEIFIELENYFGIKFLKNHKPKISFIKKRDIEKEILKEVKENMSKKDNPLEPEKSISSIDFSKRENLSDVTLNDLVNMKREKDKIKEKKREKIMKDSLMGEDLDLEEDIN